VADLIRRLGEVAGLKDLMRPTQERGQVRTGAIAVLEDAFRDMWNLGRNLVLVWSKSGSGIDVLAVPHYVIALPVEPAPGQPSGDGDGYIQRLLAGPKCLSQDELQETARRLGYSPTHVPLLASARLDELEVSDLVKRFGITYVGPDGKFRHFTSPLQGSGAHTITIVAQNPRGEVVTRKQPVLIK